MTDYILSADDVARIRRGGGINVGSVHLLCDSHEQLRAAVRRFLDATEVYEMALEDIGAPGLTEDEHTALIAGIAAGKARVHDATEALRAALDAKESLVWQESPMAAPRPDPVEDWRTDGY